MSDEGGAFRISGVPPGRYAIEAWHEVYGLKTFEVTVDPWRDGGPAHRVFFHQSGELGGPLARRKNRSRGPDTRYLRRPRVNKRSGHSSSVRGNATSTAGGGGVIDSHGKLIRRCRLEVIEIPALK